MHGKFNGPINCNIKTDRVNRPQQVNNKV